MKTKDLLLIALVCVNFTLGAMAIGLHLGRAENAAIAATSSRAGDYVMVTGPISTSREAIMVIDLIAKRANLYAVRAGTTPTGNDWELVDSRNLTADFGVGAGG
jgi:hypothetical protein